MAISPDNISMALFCDFENVALGVRDAKYEKFDIKLVLERLLLKGSIVVKKAYCDWERYKGFKAGMHEANFELIEIPHVRQSGKNSADIRLVVDALDLCYTKSHVNTFVVISGDSDFSPLVSKLRENAKQVIGVGVKQSTSDLLIANCDEFIFYDDLVRETRQAAAKREPKEAQPSVRRSPEEEKRRKEETDARRTRAIEMAVETFDALLAERGDTGKIWASVLKEAIKRRKPDFSETRFGFKAFGNLLEEARSRGLLEVGRDEKSGTYVFRSVSVTAGVEAPALTSGAAEEGGSAETFAAEGKRSAQRSGRSTRKPVAEPLSAAPEVDSAPVVEQEKPPAGSRKRRSTSNRQPTVVESALEVPQAAAVVSPPAGQADGSATEPHRPRKTSRRTAKAKLEATSVVEPAGLKGDGPPVTPASGEDKPTQARKAAPRARRPRKTVE